MPKKALPPTPCKRPYTLGKRQAASDERRASILAATRELIESKGFLNLSLEAVARQADVTRQTVYNLFGARADLIEALFDQLALQGGMSRMREVAQLQDAEIMLSEWVHLFVHFWGTHRLLIRRIQGLAAIDPEFGEVLRKRNERRRSFSARIVDMLAARHGKISPDERTRRITLLHTFTSFAFFDGLSEGIRPVDEIAPEIATWIVHLAAQAMGLPLEQRARQRARYKTVR